MPASDPAHPGQPVVAAAAPQLVIALGRGGYGMAAQHELNALCEDLRRALPQTYVAPAYVDRASPSLPEALDACLRACPEATQVVVQPMFLPVDNALLRWLEKIAQRWRHRQPDPGTAARVVFAPPLGSLGGLAHLLARHLDQAARLPDITQTAPARWERDPVGWSKVPQHQRHALVCMGPRCTAMGAATLWSHLTQALRRGSKRQKSVIPLQTGCQFPCNRGPLMIVYPDGIWYGPLTVAAMEHILEQHLEQGAVVKEYVVHGPGHARQGDVPHKACQQCVRHLRA